MKLIPSYTPNKDDIVLNPHQLSEEQKKNGRANFIESNIAMLK